MNNTVVIPILELYPDPESARVYFEERRWNGHIVCPCCGRGQCISVRTGRRNGNYRCGNCSKEFTVRTGTIFERSHLPLHKWLYSMFLVATTGNRITSLRLAKDIGVTQKTAWSILGRLQEACGDKFLKLSRHVEPDET